MSEQLSLLLEPAEPADLPLLGAIAEACGLQVSFEAELARDYALLRVARTSSTVAGFALGWRAADELHLTDLGVAAEWRRRGVARRLVLALCAEARAGGLRVVLLEVRASNEPALALYASLGFVELDRRRRYYAEPEEDAVVMQLELG